MRKKAFETLPFKKTNKSVLFVGTDRKKEADEIWLTNSEARQHVLVTGGTGAGKSELLISMMTNALAWGGGGIFVDGKGDQTLALKLHALAEHFGRRDDFYVLDFYKGDGRGPLLRSNTFNPFATLPADFITQIIVSLMDDTGGDGAMWKGRATAMMTGTVRVLTWLRDNKKQKLNVETIRQSLLLKKIIDFAESREYDDIPDPVRNTVRSYLASLPGYSQDRGYKQSQTTLDQHGYLEMQFFRILSSLADVYSSIFCADNSEVDLHDIILNRRVLLVTLPAMEKSGDEIANLGKIITASIKAMAGSMLGASIKGSWYDQPFVRSKSSDTPFLCILDEASTYMAEGMDLLAAQSRSLGISMVFSTQDLESLFLRNARIAHTILGNTTTKIFMRCDGVLNTLYTSLDGVVFETTIWQRLLSMFRQKNTTSSLFAKLMSQKTGEFLITHRGTAKFGKFNPINVKTDKRLVPNLYVSSSAIADKIVDVLRPKPLPVAPPVPAEFAPLTEIQNSVETVDPASVIQAAITTIMAFETPAQKSVEKEEFIEIGH